MRKHWRRIPCFWHRLSHQGVHSGLTSKEAKRVVLSNVLFLNTGLLILPLYALYHFLGIPQVGAIIVATGLLFIACSAINRTRRYNLARASMLGVAILVITLLAFVLGRETMMHLLLISAACYTVVLFDPNDKKWISAFLGVSIAVWLMLEMTDFSLLPTIALDAAALRSIYIAVIGVLAATCMMSILHFVNSNASSERQLERQRQFLRTLIDASPNFVFAKDSTGRYTLINKAMANAYGREPRDLVGKSDDDFIFQAGNAESFRDEDQEVLTTLQEKRAPERCFLDADGNVRWFLTVKRPIIEGDGSANQLLGIAMDITERKRAEQAVLEREARFRDMAENVPGMIFQWCHRTDGTTGFTYVSQRVEEMFGLTVAEVLEDDRTVVSRIHPDDVKAYTESVHQAVTQQAPWRFEGRLKNNRGEYAWYQGTSRPTSWGDGDLYFNGVLIDVSARRRTQQIMEAALYEAQRANRTKSEFLANISHEIRTPLNAVIGMTSLMLQTELTTEQAEYCETIRTSGDALLTLISDILDFSKIEAGTLDLDRHPFNLRTCLEESLDLLAERAAQKRLNLAYLMDPDVPLYIEGDDARLRQVLVNLLSNAVKFTDEGEVFVQVRSQTGNGGAHELMVSVSDTGIGIPQDKFARLFKSFSQVDSSTSRRYGGTGLGLAISKKLVKLMGGRIWAESEIGRGSTFSFTVEAKPVDAPTCERVDPASLAGKRVLIVDDLPTNRRILEQQTRIWGMQPTVAESSSAALSVLKSSPAFDVAIVDLCMPDVDGLGFASDLRKLDDGSDLPLILLTSIGDKKIRAEAQKAGFARFLYKPIKQSQLYDALAGTFASKAGLDTEKTLSPADQSRRERRPARPLTILIAEDFIVNQKVAVRMLDRIGYRADTAANGSEVLELLDRIRYDVILMDVHMPELDGLETTRIIRSKYAAERQPYIIAMTAHAMKGDREECLATGMDDYLSKPVKLELLDAALKRAASRTYAEIEAVTVPFEEPSGPLNPASFEKLVGTLGTDDVEVLQEIVQSFIANAAVLLRDMSEGLENDRINEVQRGAHTLKSACALFGADIMVALCTEIEDLCRPAEDQFDRDRTRRLLSEADAEYQVVVDRLSAYVPVTDA